LYHYGTIVKSFLNNENGSYLYQTECPVHIIICVVFVPVRHSAGVSHTTTVYVFTYYVDSIYSGRRRYDRNVNPDGVRLIIYCREQAVIFIVCSAAAIHRNILISDIGGGTHIWYIIYARTKWLNCMYMSTASSYIML